VPDTLVMVCDRQQVLGGETAVDGLASNAELHYRPEVDGLRAVAVLSVLLFHAFPSLLPGGFVGVDMFFVISGFLITGIILKGLQHGNFSFREFYARRVGRIFPSLFLVLSVCLTIGWFVLFPDEYRQLAKHSIAGAVFISNLLLWHQAGYFDTAARSKPLLHLWSLGIEEQFYIAWPLMFVLVWKWTKRVPAMIVLAAFVSFCLNIWLIGKVPNLTFYFPITRIWELLIGSSLAWFAAQREAIRSTSLTQLFAVLGILLIAISLAFAKGEGSFPGWFALLPTLGTALVIGAGSNAWINRTLLASPLCVSIGLISYPLYLWHWPLLVYLKLIVDSDCVLSPRALALLKIAVLVISVGLAWGTWRFWEVPLRKSARVARSATVPGLVSAMCLVTLVGALSLTNVVTPRLNNPFVKDVVQAVDDWDYPSADNFMKSDFVLHVVRSRSKQETLFVGDSHMEQYWPRAKTAIQNNPFLSSAIFATSSGCPPFPDLNRAKNGFACPQFYKYWNAIANSKDIQTVVIGAAWEFYFVGEYPGGAVPPAALSVDGRPASSQDVDRAWKGLETTIRSLVHSGKRVVILSSSPAAGKFNPRGMLHRFGGLEISRLLCIDESEFKRYIAPIEDKLAQIATRTGATVIHPTDYFCETGVCRAIEGDGSPIYRDDQHLRPISAVKRAVFIDATLRP